jgi:hypothetical protein
MSCSGSFRACKAARILCLTRGKGLIWSRFCSIEMLKLWMLGLRQGAGLGPELCGKLGQHPGIEPVGLGQDAPRPGKIPDRPGIKETGREPMPTQTRSQEPRTSRPGKGGLESPCDCSGIGQAGGATRLSHGLGTQG